ncbi:pilus assembly protein TadG-related protein [Desulforudis sp. 1088]|jgi:cytoskeletal protein CcmA (bactofilin family)|uniref:pilus assembly protein TadG-related protein n=1 Tax=unclassified Candidatus Desulforudis TaxID=2635950 RepID=UPI00346A2341
MVKKIACLLQEKKGSALVLVCGALVALIGFVVLTVDVGQMALWKARAAQAADAAAIAGAWELPSTSAADARARYFAGQNGINDLQINYEKNNRRIIVKASRDVDFLFAPVLGYNNVVISATAIAEKGGLHPVFDWAMFSGSEIDLLRVNGSPYIDGSVHTNDGFRGNGSGVITGLLSAVDEIRLTGSSWQNGSGDPVLTREGSDIIPMPDYKDELMAKAQSAPGHIYNGNTTLNGRYLTDETIFVNGDLIINGSFRGKGCIIATGDITFNGAHEITGADSIFIYSVNGDIRQNGSSRMDGIIYAPNGSITLNGSAVVNGRIISYEILCNGAFTINGRQTNTEAVPCDETVRLVG